MRERTACGLACLAVALAAGLGPSPSQVTGLAGWAGVHYRLSPQAQQCAVDRLDRNASLTTGLPDAARLRRQGLAAVPLDRRQLIGDIMLACALSTSTEP